MATVDISQVGEREALCGVQSFENLTFVRCGPHGMVDINISEEPAASIFRLDAGVSKFLQDAGIYQPHCTTSHPRRQQSQYSAA
jgi:hypothetical protein